MKRIMFFIESLAGGGAEKVLSDLVSNLDKQKYEVTVYTVTDEGTYQDTVSQHCHYKSFLNNADYSAGGLRKIIYWVKMKIIYTFPTSIVYRWLIQGKYDVEVAFIEGYATKFIASSTNDSSKKIAWVHADMQNTPYADKSYKSLEKHRATYKNYDVIACVSKSVKTAFEKKMFSSKKVCIQYNPIDSKKIKKEAKESIDLVPNPVLQMGTIGRLEEVKGYIRLLRCLGKLHIQGYQFSLWIIGEGSQKEEIEKVITEYHLENDVKLIGFQKNPYKYLNQCDAFICSSYSEGFSTAATESLILGKPVFTLDCAGMHELFGNERCGEIVENSDEALYEMLLKIVTGEIAIQDYSAAVKRCGRSFEIKQRIIEIESILE